MKPLNYDEKGICRKCGDIFEEAAQMHYSPVPFAESWCKSDTAQRLFDMHVDKIAQGKKYLLHDFQSEFSQLPQDCAVDNSDLMYWLGYMITYAAFSLNIAPDELYKRYDIPKYMAFYDVLHTLSNKRMVEELVEEYEK